MNDLFHILEQTHVCNYADDTTLYACGLYLTEHDSLLAGQW